MKLYTEEQVKDMLGGFIGSGHVDAFLKRYYTPIKLPSDEEIDNESESIFYNDRKFKPTIYEIMALRIGAKWMRDKLTNIEKQMTKQDITREQKLEYIAKLLAKAMYYGDWKWQTPNERVIELLMTDIGLYGFSSEDNMIAETGVPEELYTIARNEIHTRREYVKHSVICYHGGKYTYDPDFFECHKCGGIVEEQYRIKQ